MTLIRLTCRITSLVVAGLITVAMLAISACGPGTGVSPTASLVPATGTSGPAQTPGIGAPQGSATAAVTSQGTSTPSTTPGGTPAVAPPIPSPAPNQASCPNLESRLYNLMTSQDPATYAVNSRLYYADGKVRVIVELQSADANLPSGYNLVQETRNGALVQALVPVADLCRLSNEPQVRYVRAPLPPAT